MTQRTFGDFWRGWCETNGLPTKVVRQPIPAAPVQSDPDVQIMDAIAPAQKRLRIGDHVECRELAGVFRPCPCGSISFTVCEGKGPHPAALDCDNCHRGGRWLGRALVEVLA